MANATTPTTRAKGPTHRRRPRGEGSIYRVSGRTGCRGAILWELPDGTKKRYVVSGATEAIVRDKLRDLRHDLEATGRPTSRMTTGDYLAAWLKGEEQRVRGATYRGREQHVRAYLVPMLGRIRLGDLRPSDVDRLMGSMQAAGRSGRTCSHVRATLRRALHEAQRDGLVVRNAAALSRPPKIEAPEMRVLTAEQTRVLLDDDGSDLSPLFALAAVSGLREGELLGLTWEDVEGLDGPTPAIIVRHAMSRQADGRYLLAQPKTRRSARTVELGATAARALRRQRVRQAADRLAAGPLWQDTSIGLCFADKIGRPLRPWTVTKAFSATLARLGLPHVRLHDLRHGVASLLLSSGASIKSVSDMLGHASIQVTGDVYGHLSREARREAADLLDAAVNGHGQ